MKERVGDGKLTIIIIIISITVSGIYDHKILQFYDLSTPTSDSSFLESDPTVHRSFRTYWMCKYII